MTRKDEETNVAQKETLNSIQHQQQKQQLWLVDMWFPKVFMLKTTTQICTWTHWEKKGWTLKTPRMIRVVSRSVSVVMFTLVTYHITRYSIELSHSWLRELTKCVSSFISDHPLCNGTSAGVKWANEEPYLIVIIRFLILPSKCLRYRIKVS